MLFKRRKPQKLARKIRESLWPSMGWNRTIDYFRHRVFRKAQSPHHVAAGLAIGAGVSFTPLLGTHFAQAVFFAWVARVNVIAAFVGTAFGNPWTFPFLFWLDYRVGEYLFTLAGATVMTLPDTTLSMDYLLANPLQLFLPMLVGGIICGLLFLPVAYGILYYPVRVMQKTYHQERQKRIADRRQP